MNSTVPSSLRLRRIVGGNNEIIAGRLCSIYERMKSFESLVTPRTEIRRLRRTDKDKLVELLCDKSVTINMAFPDEILTIDGVSNLLEMTVLSYKSDNPLLSYAISSVEENEFIGVAGYNPITDVEIEIFFAILPNYWGKGYATEICKVLTESAFQEQYNTIVAPITQNNLASIKVVEKNGYTNFGLKKDPNYRDMIYLYKKERN